METGNSKEGGANVLHILRILAGALALSVFIYMFVAEILAQDPLDPDGSDQFIVYIPNTLQNAAFRPSV